MSTAARLASSLAILTSSAIVIGTTFLTFLILCTAALAACLEMAPSSPAEVSSCPGSRPIGRMLKRASTFTSSMALRWCTAGSSPKLI